MRKIFRYLLLSIIILVINASTSLAQWYSIDLRGTVQDTFRIGNLNWLDIIAKDDSLLHIKIKNFGERVFPDTNWVKAHAIALTNSTLDYFNDTFAEYNTRINQNASGISLTSVSVFGSILYSADRRTWSTITDSWSAVSEGIYKQFRDTTMVHRGEINVNSQNIELKVSSTDYTGETIASKINLTNNSVKIDSRHIAIDGETTFSNGYDPTTKITAGGAAGDVNSYSTTISGGKIRTGILQSNNWSTTKGSYFNLDNGVMKLGGSSAPTTSIDSLGYMQSISGKIGDINISTDKLYLGTGTFGNSNTALYIGASGLSLTDKFSVTNAGVITLRDGSFGLGATSYTVGNGVWLSSTAGQMFRVGNVNASRTLWDGTNLEIYNSSNTKVASFGGTNSISGLSMSTLTIDGNLTMGASGKIWTDGAGTGSNGFVLDVNGLRGYSSTLGTTFNLPTNGSAPTFSSGIINSTTFNLYTSSVIRTSATVGDGSANSAGVLINNTGVYGIGANKTSYTANFKLLASTGEIIGKLGTLGGWSMDSLKFYNTNALLHSSGYASFGATPPTSYGNNVGAWFGYTGGVAKLSLYTSSSKYFQYDGTDFSLAGGTITGGTITGGTIQTKASGPRIVIGEAYFNEIQFYDNTELKDFITSPSLMGSNFLIQGRDGVTIQSGANGDIAINAVGANGTITLNPNIGLDIVGKLTKINNISATSGYVPIGDGTSFSPRALTPTDVSLFTPAYGEMYDNGSSTAIAIDTEWGTWSGSTTGDCSGVTYDATADKLTVGSSGVYEMSYNISSYTNFSGEIIWCLYKNGTTELTKSKSADEMISGKTHTTPGKCTASLSANDYIQLKVYYSGAGTITTRLGNISIRKISN